MRKSFRKSGAFLLACLLTFVSGTLNGQSSGSGTTQEPAPKTERPASGVFTSREPSGSGTTQEPAPKTERPASGVFTSREPSGSGTTQEPAPESERPPSGVFTSREPYTPTTPVQKESRPLTSFKDGFLRDTRRHVGLSVGVFEGYIPNTSLSSQVKEPLTFTSIQPLLFFNVQKRKLDLRLTYGFNFNRSVNRSESVSRLSQNGTAAIGYTVARRKATLRLSQQLASVYNDPYTYLTSSLTALYRSDLVNGVFLDRRRETRATSNLSWSYAFTPRFTTELSSAYDFAKYSGSEFPGRQLLSAGFASSYRINEWFTLGANYFHYLNQVDERDRARNIEELEAGTFSFKLGGGWVVTSSGGIETTSFQGVRWITGSGRAGIARTSGPTTISFGYHHGYTAAIPNSNVWNGDTANLYLVQAFTRRIRIHAASSYLRGASLGVGSMADALSGSGGLEIALQNNLIVSMNYSYVSQQLGNLSLESANLRQQVVSAGLQFYLPSLASR